MKIIEKLSTYAALLGVIGAIGGGFYRWGQFNSRLDAIEATPPVNLKPLKEIPTQRSKHFVINVSPKNKNLINLCKLQNVPCRFILFSTSEVYSGNLKNYKNH